MKGLDLLSETDSSAARRLLFRDSYILESPSQIVKWWERRRLPFNVAVGATGLVSLTAMTIANAFTRGDFFPGPPILAVLAYGIAANFFFTFGWVAELILRPVFGVRTGTVGATLFRYGLAFSIGITLLPTGVAAVGVLARLLSSVL